jgi:hypothetical protein
VVDDVAADLIAQGVGVPAGASQQALHRPRTGVASVLGQPPAVLALGAGEQSEQVGAGSGARLHPPEQAGDPGHGLVERRPPAGTVYAMACGQGTIFESPHSP